MTYEWRRMNRVEGGGVSFEYATTETLDPPDDRPGWQRLFRFGVGRVEGAGDSPARPSP